MIGDAGTGGKDEKFHHPANQCVQAEQGNKAKGMLLDGEKGALRTQSLTI